ncbi:hypothetical protein F5876DRAFT_83830 [Lentinula aff. lateritia]|uniref:Uncharacterized protein n=1 Tax=Lentinula aff. lateritia TaxID=2804960 RepID=A0ACC1THJ6_9AGAR|nr:hypothetical protein F5876DRAFT_83830 [Lentinula aff. lateritia]
MLTTDPECRTLLGQRVTYLALLASFIVPPSKVFVKSMPRAQFAARHSEDPPLL